MSVVSDFFSRIRHVDPNTFGVIVMNVLSSITVVFANKWVFKTFHFTYGTTLTLVHFIVTFLGLVVCAKMKLFEVKPLKLRSMLPLSISFCGFVVLNNLSLQYNSVGFYQICKVLTTPVIMIIQTFWYKMTFETRIKLSLVPVLIGVVITSVTDVEVNFIGTVYALSAVLITSMYQIWSGTKQKELQANSMQLLIYQAPMSALMLIPVVFMFDDVRSLAHYQFTFGAVTAILISALLALFVNLSIFLVIGKTSPVTYNVVGHFKLCCIITGGFVLFGEPVEWKNLSGVLITLSGIFLYTHFKLEEGEKAALAARRAAEAAATSVASAVPIGGASGAAVSGTLGDTHAAQRTELSDEKKSGAAHVVISLDGKSSS